MKRRHLLLASLAAPLARPAIAQTKPRVMKFIPEGDPAVTRNHGYMVFDTLYGQNDSFAIEPQMVEGHVVEDDGLTWKLTLREGLRFHSGEPVRAQDVVPSIRRFAARDAFGAALMAVTDELSAKSDRVVQFRLNKRFPLLPNALGKSGTSMPAIMPERLALTDPNKQVAEIIGSGPFKFNTAKRVSGALVVYDRFDGYVPRTSGSPAFTAGPKTVHYDRIEWHVIPDAQTAASALISGEMDWWQSPTPDLLGQLRAQKHIKTEVQDTGGGIAVLRFNHLFPPFDNPAIRRALLGCIDQADYMTAVAGDDHTQWKDRVGVFSPGTPLASEAGIEVLSGKRDLERVKRELIAAGYKGERVVMLGPSDYPSTYALALVAADAFTKVGINVDLQSIDWGTLVQRRASKQPPDKGGWNVFFTYLNGTNNFDPASQLGIRGNGDKAWFGWPTAPKLEALRSQWFAAADLAEQKEICAELQRQFWVDVPYIPLGAYYASIAYNRKLSGIRSGFPQFYDVREG